MPNKPQPGQPKPPTTPPGKPTPVPTGPPKKPGQFLPWEAAGMAGVLAIFVALGLTIAWGAGA